MFLGRLSSDLSTSGGLLISNSVRLVVADGIAHCSCMDAFDGFLVFFLRQWRIGSILLDFVLVFHDRVLHFPWRSRRV